MFFQRKNSKKVKDSEGSKKKGKDGRGKKGGLDALAGSLQSAKNDAETATEKLQGDVKSGIETILHKGSGLLEKAKEELGGHSDASSSKELGSKDKEPEPEEGETAQSIDEGASADKTEEPNVLEQAVEEIQAVAAALQQTAPAAETETETETEIPVETAAAAETSASAEGDKPEETNREEEKDDPNKRLDCAGFFAMLFERFCNPGNKKKD